MSNSADILDWSGSLTPLERAVISKANGINALKTDRHRTTLEAAHQVWAIRDILIAVDLNSLVIERLHARERHLFLE